MKRRFNDNGLAAVVISLMCGAGSVGVAQAEDGACQLVPSAAVPARQILRCADGPTIEAEDQAQVHVQDPAGVGHPTGATVDKGAALIDLPPDYPGGFQILTPRAIASVRGTVWIVDAQPTETAVFVIRGRVEVKRPDGSGRIALRAGEGVDVRDDRRPLRVTRWPARRAATLLARFGRH